MKQFTYTITDPVGIHARPAGQLSKLAKTFGDTVVTISKGDASAKATQLMKLMSLGVKAGDTIVLSCDGANEDAALEALSTFLKENL